MGSHLSGARPAPWHSAPLALGTPLSYPALARKEPPSLGSPGPPREAALGAWQTEPPADGRRCGDLKGDSLFLVKAEAQSGLRGRPGEPAWAGVWNVLEVEGLCGRQAGGGRAEQSSNYLLCLGGTARAC